MATARCNLRSPLHAIIVVVAAAGLMGCNLITTADSLTVGDDGPHKNENIDNQGSGGNNNSGGGGVDGSGGSGATNATGGSGAGGPIDDGQLAVDGVSITDVVVYQGVARPIMANGQAANSIAPVVANRDALIRVYYDTNGYNGLPVTGRLTIGDDAPIQVEATLGNSSSDGNIQSTVNFIVPAAAMAPGASYRVDLVQPPEQASGTNASARFPQAVGEQDSLQTEAGGKLTITLVPVQYNADGSGRLPDTSPAQLQKYADEFYAIYPVSDVEIKVRSVFQWNQSLSSSGNGWDSLLNAISDLRNQDGVPFSEYYYGIHSPTNSFNTYCNGGCVLGLGFVGGPQDSYAHAAIGIGFSGDQSVETAIHELGHNHGRNHAPCGGAAGTDGNYPYNGAGIGVYGYNILTGSMYTPQTYVDMMSYCNPAWISDYTFGAIFDRLQFTNNAAASLYVPPALVNAMWDRVHVHTDGSVSWMPPIQLERPQFGEPVQMTAETDGGLESLTGSYVRYDHLDGGVLFIPPTITPKVVGGVLSLNIDGQLTNILQ